MADLQIDQIQKIYPNGFQAVHDLSLSVDSGEFIALLGPSGCGKSTTLRMVAGLETISAGDLFIGGKKMNLTPPNERGVAMVFQSYALYPHMTVFENMAFGLRLKKVGAVEIERRVKEVAARLDLSSLLTRRPAQMSGGQRQRVAMGRAIVRQPSVFLFDEPLSNLDAKLRSKMRRELGDLHRSLGTTSLYVTHDQIEAMTLADRIVLLNAGKVQQIGTPLELYHRPSTRFVAEFIGSPPMNISKGTISSSAVVFGTISLAISASLDVVPGDYILGIRPNHLQLVPGSTPGGQALEVSWVEPLGNETLVHLKHDDQTIVVSIDGELSPELGDSFTLNCDPSNIHVFDANSENRVDRAI